jgi:hypothetical protein
MTLTSDQLYPRDAEHRYRIYEKNQDGDLRVLAATPTAAGIGVALVQLYEDQGSLEEIGEPRHALGPIGILDTIERKWIVHPFR